LAALQGWLRKLLEAEDWEPRQLGDGSWVIDVYGMELPAIHPAAVHLKVYKETKNPELKFIHMKKAHDFIWPKEVASWHRWTERRFRAHCDGWSVIPWAGPASSAKSYDAAKIALLFWMANAHGRTAIVMSTTLESLNSRIYGYCLDLLSSMEIEFPARAYNGSPPRIGYLYDDGHSDFKHCIKALAAKRGDTSATIQNLIGRHPKEGLLVILDEGPDLPVALLEAIPNWEQTPLFQLLCMGNSSSRFDLHGSLATPEAGWENIDPMKQFEWPCVRNNSICLYFNPYDSPAISEPDPGRKALLSRFLPTDDKIEASKQAWGEDSEQFWRMGLGIWKSDKTENVVLSKAFIEEYKVQGGVEWAPNQDLALVGGLDIAFSVGGDQCILRLAVLGWDTYGNWVMDFRGKELMFKIEIRPSVAQSAEQQISEQVLEILGHFGIRLSAVALDANGQGRAVGEVIRLNAVTNTKWNRLVSAGEHMIKIYAVRRGNANVSAFDVTIKNSYELWNDLRTYIQNNQIRGLDEVTVMQLTTRKVSVQNGIMRLEEKTDYRNRMKHVVPALAHSPDEADAASLCLQAAILKYGFQVGAKRSWKIEGLGQLESQKLQAAIYTGQFQKITERPRVAAMEIAAGYGGDIYSLGSNGMFKSGY